MTHRYAEGTSVSVGRSREEIERTLERFGAGSHAWLRDDAAGIVVMAFKRKGFTYRFTLPLAKAADYATTPSGKWSRTTAQATALADAETKRRFRSLAIYIKAVLDASESGIIKAEEALMPYLVLPTGETVYERAQLQLKSGLEVDLAMALPAGRGK